MNSPISIEEVEARRKLKAQTFRILPRAEIPKNPSGEFLKGLRSSIAEAIPEEPSDNRWREEIEKADKARRIEHLKTKWNAPERQLRMTEPDRSGEWGTVESGLSLKLGSGFLIALIGTRGSGKTQLAIELMRKTVGTEKSALYRTAIEFFLKIKTAFRNKADTSEDQIVKEHSRPSLLVLDEFGRRGETDWEDRMLFEVIDRRYRDCSDTLLISNQEKPAFLESIGPSLASRMSETGGIIECNWKSFRKKI